MKVKATDKFSFPLSIDFAPYKSSGSNSQDAGSQQYDLQAILIHKGSSASQGHYGNPFSASIPCSLMLLPSVRPSVYDTYGRCCVSLLLRHAHIGRHIPTLPWHHRGTLSAMMVTLNWRWAACLL